MGIEEELQQELQALGPQRTASSSRKEDAKPKRRTSTGKAASRKAVPSARAGRHRGAGHEVTQAQVTVEQSEPEPSLNLSAPKAKKSKKKGTPRSDPQPDQSELPEPSSSSNAGTQKTVEVIEFVEPPALRRGNDIRGAHADAKSSVTAQESSTAGTNVRVGEHLSGLRPEALLTAARHEIFEFNLSHAQGKNKRQLKRERLARLGAKVQPQEPRMPYPRLQALTKARRERQARRDAELREMGMLPTGKRGASKDKNKDAKRSTQKVWRQFLTLGERHGLSLMKSEEMDVVTPASLPPPRPRASKPRTAARFHDAEGKPLRPGTKGWRKAYLQQYRERLRSEQQELTAKVRADSKKHELLVQASEALRRDWLSLSLLARATRSRVDTSTSSSAAGSPVLDTVRSTMEQRASRSPTLISKNQGDAPSAKHRDDASKPPAAVPSALTTPQLSKIQSPSASAKDDQGWLGPRSKRGKINDLSTSIAEEPMTATSSSASFDTHERHHYVHERSKEPSQPPADASS
ncbi:uncharacterized protein MONBRDRAFT_37428 [Monosiga brevicollis MX1]|uniref:Uncharacterized protein n=1 Tax=Monosiga brevicollis TaxID=81824 RepID=A9V1P1_MONBE|nr:uncharacterized protein MONBRDRAFT_37428 [Monosiga brevicollis MX1]EDQ88476.1 predicted protein [Monosiga brevicollis MX1]|eukprot:XP_001746580.1 hypothetical protein [Monosiga brevicollis MX1]